MKTDEFDIFRDEPSTPAVKQENLLEEEEQTLDPFPQYREQEEKPVVLIIDDDETVRESLFIALGNRYQVHLCSNGLEGINTVNASISAVILDIKMEDKDGFETFREIKDRYMHLPIIFHTAYQDLKDPYEVINEFRPFGYITKEGSFRQLQDTINSAVDYYRQIKRNKTLLTKLKKVNDQLEDKVEELEHKKTLLKTYSSRLETLLTCTKEMSISRDTYSAIRTATNFLMNTIELFDSSKLTVYFYQKILGDATNLISYEIDSSEDINMEPVNGVVSSEEQEMLNKIGDFTRIDNDVWIPVEYEGVRYAVFCFHNCPPRDLGEQDRGYINGILNSLSHVHKNQRNFEQQRLATIGQMASGIVHDLNNNITVIQGYAELADDVAIAREQRIEYLNLITQEASRLSDMASDILSYSRGGLELHKESYDVQEYCDDIALYLRPTFQEYDITFKYNVKSPGSIMMDGSRLRRVIYNIAINACDATGGGGLFVLEASTEGNNTIFTFTDNGPGIPEQIQDKIFQPFISLGKSHGTGLGMAMSKNIVDSHKGEIYFDTKPGKGTTFFIKLPNK